eukprot:CAMPEP_0114643476 /NCGR_PEP_ID=MMETSP0191-20121206/3410_1 /TAXON_ID=126664 /ORGANISM="Sorites sp." /LENGTH=49 /DNA_ID= /DNA_START= /DNA_END= /DNA_ORIENTATION=
MGDGRSRAKACCRLWSRKGRRKSGQLAVELGVEPLEPMEDDELINFFPR